MSTMERERRPDTWSHRLTTAEQHTIARLYLTSVAGQTPSLTWIAEQVNRSRMTVKRYLTQRGLYQQKRRLTTAEKRQIITLYRDRSASRPATVQSLGALFDRAPSTICRVLEDAGISRRHMQVAAYRWTGTGYQTVQTNSIKAGDVIVRSGPHGLVEVHHVGDAPPAPTTSDNPTICAWRGCPYGCIAVCANTHTGLSSKTQSR